MNRENSVIEPGQIAPPAGAIRHLFLPERVLFERRAGRFRQLSPRHSLEGYLTFLALLADAQQEALNQFPAVPTPDPREQARCREHGMPLLDARSWPRDPAWRAGLKLILHRMMGELSLPAAAREAAASLGAGGEGGMEEMADKILAGDPGAASPRELPFLSAALQVYWVHMASALEEHAFAGAKPDGVCPVCGSFPVSGIVHADGTEEGLRYLCCSLCASQWHMVRVTCSTCEATSGISYYTLAGSSGAVKAESCDGCNTYLKLLYPEKDGRMEATADDLATLALDMLMDEAGKGRGGPNLFLHPGAV